MDANKLHVVTCISNPVGWQSRIKLYQRFEEHMLDSGVNLTTVECVMGERPHLFTPSKYKGVNHVAVAHRTVCWHKESLLNVGISRLPPDARYIAWIDADVMFRRRTWAADTVNALQQYDVVQPWENAYDLGPDDAHSGVDTSLASLHAKGRPLSPKWSGAYTFGHPGYAWAATRQALEWIGGLIDFAALGSADHNMAFGFLGRIKETFPQDISPEFTARMLAWQDRAHRHIGINISYVPGTIEHGFHGPKKARKYVDRWGILRKHGFNPTTDLKRNTWGVVELAGNKPKLNEAIDQYLRSRNEDANTNQ